MSMIKKHKHPVTLSTNITDKVKAPVSLSRPQASTRPQAPTFIYNDTITDTQGLSRAYKQGDTYVHGNTLYIAGSHTAKDWYDDVTKIPFWGDLKDSTRYQAADKALKANPQVTGVVGHSLGGSVALELQKNNPNLQSRTYGAPVLDLTSSGTDRYRNVLDPVSIFDRGANKSIKGNPLNSMSLTHDYSNIGDKFTSTDKQTWYGSLNKLSPAPATEMQPLEFTPNENKWTFGDGKFYTDDEAKQIMNA